MVPLSLSEAAGSRLGWPLHVIDDVGHVPQIERPEAFIGAVSEILSGSHETERELS